LWRSLSAGNRRIEAKKRRSLPGIATLDSGAKAYATLDAMRDKTQRLRSSKVALGGQERHSRGVFKEAISVFWHFRALSKQIHVHLVLALLLLLDRTERVLRIDADVPPNTE
jgi:hypothetical protein